MPSLNEFLGPMMDAPFADPRWLADLVGRLAEAPSPTGSAIEPGGIVDVLEQILVDLGLPARLQRNYRNTHNAGLALGADKEPDLVICAHLDKPGYCVAELRSGKEAVLYPVSAVRLPGNSGELSAVATRFDLQKGCLTRGSSGRFLVHFAPGKAPEFRYLADVGSLCVEDQITFFHPARLEGTRLTVNSLDDSAGVAASVSAAALLSLHEEQLKRFGKCILFCFTDGEEWPGESQIFGMGAMRLGSAIPPPSIGAITMDTHTAGEVLPGRGLSYGFVVGRGMGPGTPLRHRALLLGLERELNALHPDSVQRNAGYFSRSDEFGFVRWARLVGAFGIPVENIHGGPETCDIRDILGGIRFLAAYCAVLTEVVENG